MSSRAEEEADPRRMQQVLTDEVRGVERRKKGFDIEPGRSLTALEQLGVAFVTHALRQGQIKTDQEIRLFPAYGDALTFYHERLEAAEGDGPNGSMVEIRDHMLPEDLMFEYVDGERVPVALKVVTVTFSPKG